MLPSQITAAKHHLPPAPREVGGEREAASLRPPRDRTWISWRRQYPTQQGCGPYWILGAASNRRTSATTATEEVKDASTCWFRRRYELVVLESGYEALASQVQVPRLVQHFTDLISYCSKVFLSTFYHILYFGTLPAQKHWLEIWVLF